MVSQDPFHDICAPHLCKYVTYGYQFSASLSHTSKHIQIQQKATKHNKRQHFQEISRRVVRIFNNLRGNRAAGTGPLPASSTGADCGSRKMQGGPRSFRQNPNRYNGSSILFSGEAAFHCIRERPNRSNFAKIEPRAAKIPGQVIDGRHFPGLPGGLERVFGRESGFQRSRLSRP